MACPRNQQRHACHDKRQCSDKAAALKAIAGLRRSEPGKEFMTYRCRFCKRWHIAQVPASIKRRISNPTGIAPVYSHWLKHAWS
ncbi:MAG TPA: hypothetical protein VMD75_16640 [Candidatus Binataceae bacterium]|nr:hypothetical protein [Candidatus Binataceae bacterium]